MSEVWSGTRDSNPRLQPWQGSRLETDRRNYAPLHGYQIRPECQSVPLRVDLWCPVLGPVWGLGAP